jgi:hypothetical protein
MRCLSISVPMLLDFECEAIRGRPHFRHPLAQTITQDRSIREQILERLPPHLVPWKYLELLYRSHHSTLYLEDQPITCSLTELKLCAAGRSHLRIKPPIGLGG